MTIAPTISAPGHGVDVVAQGRLDPVVEEQPDDGGR